MRFQANQNGVLIDYGPDNFGCSLADFLLMEPGYSLPEGATEIWNPGVHCYLMAGDQLPANSEASIYITRIALYTQALAELHPEPQLEPEPEPPPLINWQGFRLALLASASFRAWSEDLPATWREDLKLAAIENNTTAVQSIYNLLAQQFPPDFTQAEGWQAIADENHIPLVFTYAET